MYIQIAVDFHTKRLRIDNGKELTSTGCRTWLRRRGIVLELSTAYSLQCNGKAERINGTLLDMARSVLIPSQHLSNYERLWAEAVNTAWYTSIPMSSSASVNQNKKHRTKASTGRNRISDIYAHLDQRALCILRNKSAQTNCQLGFK